MILTPSSFLSEVDKVGTSDVVMVAYLAPPRPGEEAFRVVRVGLNVVAEALGFLVIDPVQRVLGV